MTIKALAPAGQLPPFQGPSGAYLQPCAGELIVDKSQYNAFISYSRSVDSGIAAALEKSLKTFAKPIFRLRALRVFRDDASLTATPSLWGAIEDALSRSRFFILLASPESANSSWVRRELEWWLEHRSAASLLIVVTDGVLSWDSNKTTSFPIDLFHRVATEPRWIDLRWARNSNDLSRRNPKFADNLADLAGWIHGRSKDELVGEDIAAHKRIRAYATLAIAMLLLLAVTASMAAVIALEQRSQALNAIAAARAAEAQARVEKDSAEAARKEEKSARAHAESAEREAIQQRNVAIAARELEAAARMRAEEESVRAESARASLLADTSTRLLAEGDKPKALGYATAALNNARALKAGESEAVLRAEKAMRQALFDYRASHLRLATTYRGHEGRVTDIALSDDKHFLATAGDDGTVRIYRYESGDLVREVLHDGPVARISFVEGNRYLASASRDGVLKATSIDGTSRDRTAVFGARFRGMRIVPDSSAVLVWGISGKVALWNPIEGSLAEVALEKRLAVMDAEFLPQDSDAVLLDLGFAGVVISLQERKQVRNFPGAEVGRDIKNALGVYSSNGALNVTDLRSGKVDCSIPEPNVSQAIIDVASDRLTVLKLGPPVLEFWSLGECKQVASQRMDGVIKGIVAMPADQKVVAWTGDGKVGVFGMVNGESLLLIDARSQVSGVDVSQMTRRILVWNREGRASVWSLASGASVKAVEGNTPIREAKLSESGRTAWLARESGELEVVALEEGALQDRFFHDDAVLGWRFDAANLDLLTWAADGTARHWSTRSNDIGYRNSAMNFHADRVAVDSGSKVVFATHQVTAAAWQLDSGQPVAQTTMTMPITGLLPSQDGKSALLRGENGVCVWSTGGGVGCRETSSATRELGFGESSFALFNRESSTLALATGLLVTEGFVEVANDVVDVALVGPRKALAVCRRRGTIDIYAHETQRSPSITLQVDQEPTACAGAEDRNRLLALGAAGSMTVITLSETADIVLEQWSPTITIPRDQRTRFDISHLGRDILFAGQKRLLWIDPDSRSVVRDEIIDTNLSNLAVSDDGRQLIALTNSITAMLFDRKGGPPRKLDHRSLVTGRRFLRGGKKLATWSADQTVKVWGADDWRVEQELPHIGIVLGVAETPDGVLVTWTDRSYITYWDLDSGMMLFEMHSTDTIDDIKFLSNPDRMFVAFEHEGPMVLPYDSRQGLGTVGSSLLSALRPFGPTEACILKPASARCGTPRRRTGASSLSGEGSLAGWDGAAELSILKDGGVLLVTDRPLPDIVQVIEYNDFDQLITLFTDDGVASTLAFPVTAAIIDSLRRQKVIIIYHLFPDHDPIGYQVPLARQ